MSGQAKTQKKLVEDLNTNDKDPFLNLTTVARALGKHSTTIRNWVNDGIIAATRFPNGLYKIRKSDLEKLLSVSRMRDNKEILDRVSNLEGDL
ncbi:Helix-turn-helix domain protein [Pirellula sp. SH-Sr6A]|uniref:helix-turn-helix domain-containing protein n=1 Tax=Pirellula sp. SH-Sr6A TaxID=1632865 RepID=UPI00078E4612|nr:helix-turn-helix domain-containing protein [Pirellula sp. SH-Sr6A]AMV31322.1 Helix-turn-helix domain protein [Pirellula sp. SH-Sr6A]